MSFAVDSNIWIYGLDSASSRHRVAQRFLSKMARGDDEWVITWSIIYEVLRVITHPAVCAQPQSSPDAVEALFGFLDDARIRVLHETEDHREFLTMVIRDCGSVRGNFWHDCHIAATLLEHGTNLLYTCDRDFRKIAMLKSVDPLA